MCILWVDCTYFHLYIYFLKYHANAYDDEEELLRAKGLDCQCLGGGRILHEPDKKYIKVYGYSMGFGKNYLCGKNTQEYDSVISTFFE